MEIPHFTTKYEAKLEFAEERSLNQKFLHGRSMDIFWNNAFCTTVNLFLVFWFFLPPDYFPTCQFDEIKSVKTLYVIQNEIE